MSSARIKQLANRALLGVDRLDAGEVLTHTQVDALVAELPADTPIAKRVLLAAGGALAIERAATPATPAPALFEPAPPDDQPVLSERAARLVLEVLKAPNALREFGLRRVRRLNAVLPHHLLVEALSASLDPAGKAALLPLLGTRGQWLSQQSTLWSWVAATVDRALSEDDVAAQAREVFETATTKARAAALTTLVSIRPAEALALIETTWKADSAPERSQWLQILATKPSEDVADKLRATVATDRATSVRKTALRLLATMPTGALRDRMLERAVAAFSLQRASRLNPLSAKVLTVTPPSELPTDWADDGIMTAKAGSLPWSQRSDWLVQVVSVVSPLELAKRLGISLAQLCHRLSADDWWVVNALVSGAANHGDVAALGPLLDGLELLSDKANVWPSTEPLARLLGRLTFSQLDLLAQQHAAISLDRWLMIVDALRGERWSPEVSQIFCRRCRPLIGNSHGQRIQRYWTEPWLHAAAHLDTPALNNTLTWPEWTERSGAGVRRVLEQLALRQRIDAVLRELGV